MGWSYLEHMGRYLSSTVRMPAEQKGPEEFCMWVFSAGICLLWGRPIMHTVGLHIYLHDVDLYLRYLVL